MKSNLDEKQLKYKNVPYLAVKHSSRTLEHIRYIPTEQHHIGASLQRMEVRAMTFSHLRVKQWLFMSVVLGVCWIVSHLFSHHGQLSYWHVDENYVSNEYCGGYGDRKMNDFMFASSGANAYQILQITGSLRMYNFIWVRIENAYLTRNRVPSKTLCKKIWLLCTCGQGCDAGAQAILDGRGRSQNISDGGVGTWNLGSRSTDIFCWTSTLYKQNNDF